jgi:hypothetical protein
MRYRLAGVTLLPALVALVAATTLGTAHAPAPAAAIPPTDPDGLVVHEWGTFTSIASLDGAAIDWFPQEGPSDLPCFVRRLTVGGKGLLIGTVRMETPVLYFYSPKQTTVNVKVRFPKGIVSEWYPDASVTPLKVEQQTLLRPNAEGTIAWSDVKVAPGMPEDYKTEAAKNHYYAARATDATPVMVGDDREKFLFYRGVGTFQPPIRPTIRQDGKIDVTSPSRLPLGDLVMFENRKGTISFRVARAAGPQITFEASSPKGDLTKLYASLERLLVDAGLYQKEAAAMVETWRDSWFEEGARLLYIVPRQSVDAILPLDITPQPKDVARVFVGRVELLTSKTLSDVKIALQQGDRAAFKSYGRFFQTIVERVRAEVSPADLPAFTRQLQSVYDSGVFAWKAPSCR